MLCPGPSTRSTPRLPQTLMGVEMQKHSRRKLLSATGGVSAPCPAVARADGFVLSTFSAGMRNRALEVADFPSDCRARRARGWMLDDPRRLQGTTTLSRRAQGRPMQMRAGQPRHPHRRGARGVTRRRRGGHPHLTQTRLQQRPRGGRHLHKRPHLQQSLAGGSPCSAAASSPRPAPPPRRPRTRCRWELSGTRTQWPPLRQ